MSPVSKVKKIGVLLTLLRGFMGQYERGGCNLDANFMGDVGEIVSKN